MCGPFAIPLALMAAGSVAQAIGSGQAQHAQQSAFSAERQRQQQFTQQQQGLFENSLGNAAAMADPAHEQAAVDHRQSALTAAIAPPGPADYLPGSSSANPVVRTAADAAGAQQRGASTNLAAALARLDAPGDQLLTTNIENARNAGRIGQIGSFMQGSNAAGEAEVQAAAHKGEFLRSVGGLAQTIGQAMAMKGGGAGGGKAMAMKGGGAGGGKAPILPAQWSQLAGMFGKGGGAPAVAGWNLG